MISWTCEHCGQHLEAEDELTGRECPCPSCKAVLAIPPLFQATASRPAPPPLPEFKKCPFCAEQIRIDAIKCKHCGSSLVTPPVPANHLQIAKEEKLRAMPNGRFSCPQCHSQKTVCERDINFAVLIIIFVSLGIGLIMIPFLPFKCRCRACDYRWKS